MGIISSPLHCTLVFDFLINKKNFKVSLYQDLVTDDKIVTVLNSDDTKVEDEKICRLITKYAIEKYSITYDPGEEDPEEEVQGVPV